MTFERQVAVVTAQVVALPRTRNWLPRLALAIADIDEKG
jgi:hypothetical protein